MSVRAKSRRRSGISAIAYPARARRLLASRSRFSQEHVVRGVRHVQKTADSLARPLMLAAPGVDPLHGGDIGKNAAAAPGGYFKLQPGDVIRFRAGGVAGYLCGHGAAV